ncbi:protein YgfX [Alteromonas sp. H39]|uniref:protein YgfX n=1 Tax=Alteromonas sp. H39 TaxID=3389876 RepID=UPI0039DFDCD0
MSKSNLTIFSLCRYPVDRLIPVGITGLVIMMMPEPVWSWVPQWLAWTILVSVCALVVATPTSHRPAAEQFSLDEAGVLIRTAIDRVPVDEHPYVIGHQSRVTALAIYLLLKPARGRLVHRWVFRSQCCERDYRQLCRLISRISRPDRENT